MNRGLWIVLMGLDLCLVTSAAASAQATGQKPAWQWTLEERLAKRFDPAQIQARAIAERARQQELQAMGMPGTRSGRVHKLQDSFNGQETPELFLPSELFENLLLRGFPPDGRHQQESRRSLEERAAALGFGADFWKRLGRAAAPYLELRRERDRLALADQRSTTEASRLNGALTPNALCQARHKALNDAKALFGEEVFLRLLYEAVAPNLGVAYLVEDGIEEDLRRTEGGCR